MSGATLSMSIEALIRSNVWAILRRSKMYTIWFTIDGDEKARSFTGPIESTRVVYDDLKVAGVQMNCTRP